ncbi:hypothetical protein L1280_002645 [Deinococcus sp. HSC-46F16]|uniref:hypothetical protein n=1 Tax=unclassified Deinococcus TaxID=2623546 RepID=UPI000CF4A0B9|nr:MULTISPECIES: hypothetical protein [unclassified Deinococcus]MCP2015483.1 hypothetical protein [Deinococcus sp. HSC-46F16]
MPYAVRLQYVHKDAHGDDALLDEPHWLESDAGERRVFPSADEAGAAAQEWITEGWRAEVVEVAPGQAPSSGSGDR